MYIEVGQQSPAEEGQSFPLNLKIVPRMLQNN
jgi:hypothetical protein